MYKESTMRIGKEFCKSLTQMFKKEKCDMELNMSKIVRELKEEFYKLNKEVNFAKQGTKKYDDMMEAYVGGTIHERLGINAYDAYKNYTLDSR